MSQITRIALIFAVAAAMLAVSPSLFEPFVILKLALLSAGLCLAWLGLLGRRLRPTKLDAPLAALWAAMLASAALSGDWPVTVFGRYPQLFYGLLPLGLCTAAYYAVAANPDAIAADELLAAILAASVPLSLYGVAQRFNLDFLLHIPVPDQRVYSTIGSPVFLGACLVPLVPVALHWAIAKKSTLGWLSGLSMCAAMALTLSRGAWISATAAAVFYLWATDRLPRLRARHWGALAAAALGFLAIFEALYAKRMSDSMRWEIYRSTWPMFASHPLLGWGPDNFLNAFRAHKSDEFLRVTKVALVAHPNGHNDLIQAAVTLGGLGLFAYGWLLWTLAVLFRRLLKKSSGAGEHAAIAAGLLGLFIQAKVNPVPLTGLVLAAVLAGLACRARERAPLRPALGWAACLLAAAFCAANAAVWSRFYSADREFLQGVRLTSGKTLASPGYMDGVNALRRATELNPWVIDYTRQRLDVIFRVAALVSPEQGRQLVDKALVIATADEALHPGNASTHEMRATALELLKRFGVDRLAEALEETRIASSEDPTALFTMQRRMEIARALGDKAEFDRTLADYRRVVALTGENPLWEPLLK